MEPGSSDPKGKGRAPEYAHLPIYGHSHRETQEELDSGMDWSSGTEDTMPPLYRTWSHSEDAPDDLGNLGQDQRALELQMAHDAYMAEKLQSAEYDGADFTHLLINDDETPSRSAGSSERTGKSISWGLPETDCLLQGQTPDMPNCPPSPRPRNLQLEEDSLEGGLFGDIPRRLPSPRKLQLNEDNLEDEYENDQLWSSPSRDIQEDEDSDCEVVFDDVPPTPRPRHCELHPSRVQTSVREIGEGDLEIEDAYSTHVEEVEVYQIPEIEYSYVNIGVGPFLLWAIFETRVRPFNATNVIPHPSLLDAFEACFSTYARPDFLQHVLQRHPNQFQWFSGRRVLNYGQRNLGWVVAALQPVYQASIETRFGLLARVLFNSALPPSYTNRPPLCEGGKTVIPEKELDRVLQQIRFFPERNFVRVFRNVRQRKRKASNPIEGRAVLRGGHLYTMADQVSGVAGGATGGAGGLSSISGAIQGGVGSVINTGQGYLDRWFPPDKRESLKSQLTKFATERPKMAGFILSQVALSGLPLGLFIVMTITVVLFALIIGLLVGLIGALIFIVFALGFALLILLPTLFFTTFAAVFIFLFGLGAYYIVKWFNEESIPGIHTPLKEGIQKKMGMQDVPALNGEAPPSPPASEESSAPASSKPRPQKSEKHEKTHGVDEEKEHKPSPNHKESPDNTKKHDASQGRGTGADTNGVGGAGGELKKKTAGVGA